MSETTMLQLGDFKLPMLDDFVLGTESIVGNIVVSNIVVSNIVEGIIADVTGDKVTLTPGAGIDSTHVECAGGMGEVKFEQKMASHKEVERLRHELEKELTNVKGEIAKLNLRRQTDRQLAPGVRPAATVPAAKNGAAGMSPMMAFLPTRGNSQLNIALLAVIIMIQQMGTSLDRADDKIAQHLEGTRSTHREFSDCAFVTCAVVAGNYSHWARGGT